MLLKPHDAAARYGVSIAALRRWTKMGILQEHRTPGRQFRYDSAEIENLFNISSNHIQSKPLVNKEE